jgi:hypothetical protein
LTNLLFLKGDANEKNNKRKAGWQSVADFFGVIGNF